MGRSLATPMADVRKPVKIELPGGHDFWVSMKWRGGSGPVLSGDCSKFTVIIDNTGAGRALKGSLALQMGLTSPFTGWAARPSRVIPFAVGPRAKACVEIPDEWLFVEGKLVYILKGCDVEGLEPNSNISLEHPLASLTVFERSTHVADRNRSWITLLLAGTAAVASIVAAAAALHG